MNYRIFVFRGSHTEPENLLDDILVVHKEYFPSWKMVSIYHDISYVIKVLIYV